MYAWGAYQALFSSVKMSLTPCVSSCLTLLGNNYSYLPLRNYLGTRLVYSIACMLSLSVATGHLLANNYMDTTIRVCANSVGQVDEHIH